MENIKIKKEFKELIEPLKAVEYKQLEENILKEGIREPILTWDGFIVDGHNRFEIAKEYNLVYTVKELDKKKLGLFSKKEVKDYIIDNQLGRRNISDFSKYMLIRTEKEKLLIEGKEKQKETLKQGNKIPVLSNIDKTGSIIHNTRKIMADKLGWSESKVAQADYVLNNTNEMEQQELRTEHKSINEVYSIKFKEHKKALRLKRPK